MPKYRHNSVPSCWLICVLICWIADVKLFIHCSVLPNISLKCRIVNSLRPSDAIWRQWSWTTLAQVMACCLTAPSHYLNQCWLITRGVLWHTSESSFAGIAQGIDSGYEFEKDILKNIFKSPRGQWVKCILHCVATKTWFTAGFSEYIHNVCNNTLILKQTAYSQLVDNRQIVIICGKAVEALWWMDSMLIKHGWEAHMLFTDILTIH